MQRAHTLGAVDEHALDVGGRGRPGVEHQVVVLPELRPQVGVLEPRHDVGRVMRSVSASSTEPVSPTASTARTTATSTSARSR